MERSSQIDLDSYVPRMAFYVDEDALLFFPSVRFQLEENHIVAG